MVLQWMKRYDLLYFFPAEGTTFRAERFREPTDTMRNRVDAWFLRELDTLCDMYPAIKVARGTYRERAEYVYSDVLACVLGETRPARVLAQIALYVREGALSAFAPEIRMLGSRSITRSHRASEDDDYDLLIGVDATTEEAERLHKEVLLPSVEYLENCCECTLDIKVVAKDMLPREI